MKRGPEGRGSDLEELPELKLMVASFLQGLLETSDDEGEKMPPEPAILDFSLWVPWRAERCEIPDWWMELSAVLEKEDARKASQGGEDVLHTSTAVAGTGFKEGHSPGSPCTTMPLQKEVYAPSQLNLCMLGHSRDPQGKKCWCMPGPSSIGWSKTICLLEVSHAY